jgi:hypothetical protein
MTDGKSVMFSVSPCNNNVTLRAFGRRYRRGKKGEKEGKIERKRSKKKIEANKQNIRSAERIIFATHTYARVFRHGV